MSRIIPVLFLLGVLLTACRPSSRNAAADTQQYAWVVATASPENTVTGIFAQVFAEKVTSLSDGKMKLKVYHNSVLGGDAELFESCQCGDIPFVVQNTAPEVSYLPQLCLFDLPCLFDSLQQLYRVLDNERFMQQVNSIYEQGHFHLLAMADQNFRVMTANKPIKQLGDLKGIKIRTMENSYHMDFWSRVGANPTPMAFSELYVGLEQHMVDAQENPYEVICSNGFYEVQKYVIETNHLPHLLALVTNNDFFRGLNAEQQSIIRVAAGLARDVARQQAIERSQQRIDEIKASGTFVQQLPVALRKEMREKAEPLFQRIRQTVANDSLFNAYCQ